VLVEYDTQIYPEEIKQAVEGSTKYWLCIKCGGSWHWPTTEDRIFYNTDQIVKKLKLPEVVGCRDQFKFDELC